VVLGEPVIGLPATLSVSGAAQLADGSGSAVLDLRRLDGPEGRFTLQAGFDNATRVLALDLSLQEAEGGLTAELLDLPGAPSVGLTVSGEGPLDDIDIDVGLSTDGVERLDGYVRSTRIAEASEQRIDIALDGDLTPLMAEEYRAFFGQGSALSARITREDSGATRLQDMRLASAALLLEGDLSLDAAARPTIIDVTGRVTPPDGAARIVLPVPGADTSLAAADLAVAFDAAADEAFTVSATLDDLRAGDLSITDARIAADGRIEPSETGIARLLADLDMEFDGIDHDTPALAEALGPALGLSARADWNAGGAFQLSDIALAAGDITASGDVAMDTGDGTLPVTFDLDTIVADLSRFSGLSGQSLSGALEAGLSGDADALSGAFDIALTGTGRDLRAAAPAVPDALLAGETRSASGVARWRRGADRDADARRHAGVARRLRGPVVHRRRPDRDGTAGGPRSSDHAVRGPATVTRRYRQRRRRVGDRRRPCRSGRASTARADGRVGLEGGRVDWITAGRLPLALANRFISPRSDQRPVVASISP
jgi:translocation and assembly module TamB